jgi:cysteine desulfurase
MARPHGRESRHPPGRPRRSLDLDLAAERITDRTGIVAAMLVNNEIGVIQPIADRRDRPRPRRPVPVRRGPGLRPRAAPARTPATWSPSPPTRSTAPRASAPCGCAKASRSTRSSTAAARKGGRALRHPVARALRRLRRRARLLASGPSRTTPTSPASPPAPALTAAWTLNGSATTAIRQSQHPPPRRRCRPPDLRRAPGRLFPPARPCASGSGRSVTCCAPSPHRHAGRSSIRLGFGRYTRRRN